MVIHVPADALDADRPGAAVHASPILPAGASRCACEVRLDRAAAGSCGDATNRAATARRGREFSSGTGYSAARHSQCAISVGWPVPDVTPSFGMDVSLG